MRRTAPSSSEGADAPRSPRREQRVRRMQALVAGMLLVPGATGCYESHAVRGATPLAGTEISLAITDRGRVGLGPQMGEMYLASTADQLPEGQGIIVELRPARWYTVDYSKAF